MAAAIQNFMAVANMKDRNGPVSVTRQQGVFFRSLCFALLKTLFVERYVENDTSEVMHSEK